MRKSTPSGIGKTEEALRNRLQTENERKTQSTRSDFIINDKYSLRNARLFSWYWDRELIRYRGNPVGRRSFHSLTLLFQGELAWPKMNAQTANDEIKDTQDDLDVQGMNLKLMRTDAETLTKERWHEREYLSSR